ncbi:FlgD immunoglobulin-like domain containing protein [Candidatus Latescibacterota bacterium]
MKFKFSVLALLVVGLVFGLSGSAFATVTFSLDTTNSIADADVEIATTGIPATVVSVANDSTAAVTIDNLSVQTVLSGAAAGFYEIWWDKDENGIVSDGDVKVKAAAALTAGATTSTADALSSSIVVAADTTTSIIFVVDTTGSANAETIKIGTGGSAQIANNTSSPVGAFFVNNATAGEEPDPTTGTSVVATLTTITDAGADAALSAASTPVAAGTDVANKSSETELLNFTVTADAGVGMTITAIGLADGATTVVAGAPSAADVVASVDEVKVYIDLGTVGTLDDADIELPLANSAYTSDPEQIVLTSGVYIPGSGTVELLVTGSLTGANADGDIISLATDVTNFLVASGDAAAAGDITGAIQTLEALTLTMETKDLTGASANPNGYIDAVKMTFSMDIDDATFNTANSWSISGSGAYTDLVLNPAYNSDVADDDVVYYQFTELALPVEVLAAAGSDATNAKPAVTYNATTMVVSDDGEYALAAFTSVQADDGAAPYPMSIKVYDTDTNGMIDNVLIQFSEDVVGANLVTGNGLSVPDYTIAAGAGAPGVTDGAATWVNMNTSSIWDIDLTEDDYDTDATPAIAYIASGGQIADAAGNLVASWTPASVGVQDLAAPQIVSVKTKDDTGDGKFDALEVTFSEPVTGTAGFTFLAPQLTVYTMGSVSGANTNVYSIAVTGPGSIDTGIVPNVDYAGAAVVDLSDAANALAAIASPTLVVEDDISPILYIAETADNDGDGKLDGMNMVFSEAMDPTSAKYVDLAIGDYTVTGATVVGTNVAVALTEMGYDTGDLPVVTYDSLSVVDANGAKLAAIAAGDITVKDAAAPVLYLAETEDMGYGDQLSDNGQIDGLTLYFSEAIDTTGISTTASTAVGFTASAASGYTAMAATPLEWASDTNSAVLAITESGTDDSGVLVDVNYSGALTDKATVPIALGAVGTGVVTLDDKARPSLSAVSTIDDDGNGVLDGLTIVFSEMMDEDAFDEDKIADELSIDGIGVSFEDGVTIKAGASDSIWTFVGTEEDDTDYNTGEVSTRLDLGTSSSFDDLAGNEVNDHDRYSLAGYDDGVPVDGYPYYQWWNGQTTTRGETLTTDGAAAIIVKAMSQVGTKNISVQLSEPVTGTGASLKGTDFTYVNVYDDTLNTISTAAGITVVDADSTLFIIKTDTDVSLDYAMVDSLTITSSVKDVEGNAGVTKNVTILDSITPTVVSANTMDVNGDGMIDNIKIVLTEPFKTANLKNFLSATSPGVYVRATSGVWTAGGYKVLGINLAADADGAEIATFAAGAPVFDVDDVDGDEILYLALKQSGVADTDTTLVVTMVSGAAADGGSGLSDYSPNYVTIDSLVVEDGAGPGIFNAWMPSETELEIILSEPAVGTLPLANAALKWIVGNQSIDYVAEGWILSLEQLTDGILTMKVQNGTNVPELMESTIEFLAADVIEDAEGNGNVVALVPFDVMPFITSVEEDNLPDAFALSQNFPNPFNPTTTIGYAIPADGAGHVEMVIYNSNGQKIRTLVNETQDAGYYNVVWDGRSDSGEMVSSGLYVYKIVSGSFSKSDRMTFMK